MGATYEAQLAQHLTFLQLLLNLNFPITASRNESNWKINFASWKRETKAHISSSVGVLFKMWTYGIASAIRHHIRLYESHFWSKLRMNLFFWVLAWMKNSVTWIWYRNPPGLSLLWQHCISTLSCLGEERESHITFSTVAFLVFNVTNNPISSLSPRSL